MKNKKWFTLLEVLLSVIILSLFIWTIISIYTSIKWADWKIANKRILISETSDLIDVIHEAAIEYTIDYEEYFNRQHTPIGTFTQYWNAWLLYYCSEEWWAAGKYKTHKRNTWCVQEWIQKYLEYYYQHFKVQNIWNLNSIENKNAYMWVWPLAIAKNTWLDYLYLINWDGTERLYFRRVYVTWIDLNHDWDTSWKNEQLFKVQMLKLKWFDAWSWHNFLTRWAYDWFTDTWACDAWQWFHCSWTSVQESYNLPFDENDWWIDITTNKVTVRDMKIDIFPAKDPYLALKENDYRYDPYAKINFTMDMYWEESNDEIVVSTTLSFKNSYKRFPVIEYTWYIAVEDDAP